MAQQLESYTVDGVTWRGTPRNEMMMIVEVETDLSGTFTLAEQAVEAPGHKAGQPKSVHKGKILTYESFLPSIQAQVRTDLHEAGWRSALAEAPSTDDIMGLRRKAEAAATRAALSNKTSDRDAAENQAAALEHATFCKALNVLRSKPGCASGLPPLLSAKVVKANIPPPPTPMTAMQNGNVELANVLARMMDERESKKPKAAAKAE